MHTGPVALHKATTDGLDHGITITITIIIMLA